MRASATALVAIALLLALVFWLVRARIDAVVPVSGIAEARALWDPLALDGVPPAEPTGLPPADQGPPPLAGGREAVRSTLGLRCLVFGRVVDEQRAPIAGAEVRLLAMSGRWTTDTAVLDANFAGGGNDGFHTSTDVRGRFVFEAPLPTTEHVVLDVRPDPHHAILEREFGPRGPRNQPRLVAGANDLGDMVVALTGAVEGRVVDEQGNPIPRPRLRLERGQGKYSNTTGDEEGRFVLGHAPESARAFTVSAHGWLTRENIPVQIELGRTRSVPDVVLARAPSITGVVVDAQGTPIEKATVRGTPVRGGWGGHIASGADGTFVLYLQSFGPHTLEVRASKELIVWTGARGETFLPGRTDLRVVLEPLPRMRFRVVDALTRQPVEYFGLGFDEDHGNGFFMPARDVVIAPHSGGVAEVPLLQGATRVTVEAPSYAPLRAEVVPGAEQTLALSPGSSIKGRVVKGGVPVAKAGLIALRAYLASERQPVRGTGAIGTIPDVGDLVARRPEVETNDDGTFVIPDLPAGSFTLQIDSPGMAETSISGLEVRAQTVLDAGDVELPRESIVRGKVLTAAGESPADIDVMVDLRTGGKHMRAMLDGSFEFTALRAGTHTISWRRASERTPLHLEDEREQTFDLVPGETREFVFDARDSRPTRVVVRVLRHGEPLPNVTVSAIQREPKPKGPATKHIGITGPDGVCEGVVESGVRFDLVALGQGVGVIGVGGRDLLAEVGGRIDRTILVSLGSLRVVLDSSIHIPEQGRVSVTLTPAHGEPRTWAFFTEEFPDKPPRDSTWSGHELRIGDLSSGDYEARLSAVRLDPDPKLPGKSKQTVLFDRPDVRFMIAEDRMTTIFAP